MAGSTKQAFVVDASFLLAHLLPDESSTFVDQMFLRHRKNNIILVSTVIFPFEVLNGIKMAYLRKRISARIAHGLSKDFLTTLIPLENINFQSSFLLALKKKLTVYDASYVQLSLERQIPLLSLDEKLSRLAFSTSQN